MFLTILAVAVLLAGWLIPFKLMPAEIPKALKTTIGSVATAVSLLLFASTSFIFVGSDEVGHMKRIYAGGELPQGQIIARNGENGYQSETLKPGFHFIPFLNVVYDTETLPAVEIPKGFYGLVETRDGTPLPEGAIMAQPWPDEDFNKMLDADYFLENGGEKGVQYSILKPGTYFLNLYLYKVTVGNSNIVQRYTEDGFESAEGSIDTTLVDVPKGHVGVVTSRVEDRSKECYTEVKRVEGLNEQGTLRVPLVPEGCRGIWKSAKKPGGYYLNRQAMDVTLIDTRVQTWTYAGGYTSRTIDLTVNDDGSLQQEASKTEVPVAKDASDTAVNVKVEGWPVHQNLRALVQVTPENAPIVVAAVGSMEEVEDRVVTPAIWSEVRDVLGGQAPMPTGNVTEDGSPEFKIRPVRILDVIEHREALQREVSERLLRQGLKAGVQVMEIRFGNPDIPPEMLVARKREQLATQLKLAYTQERRAQKERQATEEARARADKQHQIVQAQINVDVADQKKVEREKLGEGEKNYLTQVAEGERARAMVLGEDRVLMLNMFERFMQTLENKPELVGLVGKLVPETVVTGDGGGLEGAAAILGRAMNRTKEPEQK